MFLEINGNMFVSYLLLDNKYYHILALDMFDLAYAIQMDKISPYHDEV